MKKNPVLRLLGWLLCLALLCSLPLTALADGPEDEKMVTADGYRLVYDRQGLEAIAQNPTDKYILMADIDLGDAPWTPIPFAGKLDGNGHNLYNLTVKAPGAEKRTTIDGNHKEYDTVFAGLFSTAENATISRLHLLGTNIDVTTDENCFAGSICGYALDLQLQECSVQGRVFLHTPSQMAGVSGCVGFGTGLVTGCEADVTLVYVDTNREENCEEFLGGVLACGYMDVENTSVKLDGYASVHGYVHNGGFIGMHHIHDQGVEHDGYVQSCTMDGKITFYEDNDDRRAYCKAFVGELLHQNVELTDNTTVAFEGVETKDFSIDLLPETCAAPAYKEEVIAPNCENYGYTICTCETCGYTYTRDYTAPEHAYEVTEVVEPTCTQAGYTNYTCSICGKTKQDDETEPAHQEGKWQILQEATYTEAGREGLICPVCQEVLDEKEIPVLIYAGNIEVPGRFSLYYGEEADLGAFITPEEAANKQINFTSYQSDVVTVDTTGHIKACGRGQATIVCRSADGAAQTSCMVEVKFTPLQWVVYILTGGWFRYR